jgi:hypothetical protein
MKINIKLMVDNLIYSRISSLSNLKLSLSNRTSLPMMISTSMAASPGYGSRRSSLVSTYTSA